jgi:POTRA domain, FtsQ-type/Cell division protein FtsQ
VATTSGLAPRARVRVTLHPPSRRSLLIGAGIVVAAVGSYFLARQTSMFAVGRIEVAGGSPSERAAVVRALAPLRGTSLLALDGDALVRRVDALPTIVSASYDRAFPHTLRLSIVPERPVAVLHRGRDTWLVSARGRVITPIPNRTRPDLPRIWLPTAATVAQAAFLPAEEGGAAARALALAAAFPARIATASVVHGELTFVLRTGLELRLGEPVDLRLKLAIARRALPLLTPGTTYLDLAVPGRPVSGTQSRVSGRG